MGRQQLHRAAPRILGVPRARWLALIREELLTRPFPDAAAFAGFIGERLAAPPEAVAELRAVLDAELASAEVFPGVLSLLAFLKRRGYRLGLLSNASSVYKEPWQRLGLAPLFDAASFSCDAGACKPEPRLYLELCRALGVEPAGALMAGDSLANDVRAPRALGLRAVGVGRAPGAELASAAQLGFLSLLPGSELEPLLSDGQRLVLGGRSGTLREPRPLADAEQGRYNLVARARVVFDDGAAETVYCKRYLHPDGAHLEEFAYALLVALGIPSCRAVTTGGPEPCLVVSEAPGEKLEGPIANAPFAREVGRQAALAYLFANADLRPRNGFLSETGGAPTITMTDLEHCFLNQALDVSGIADPMDPASFDRLGAAELEARVVRRVLTPRTMKRARRAFLGSDSLPAELEQAFKDGWMAAYRSVQAHSARALELLDARRRRAPFLVVGTQAYRRALARLDVDDIRRRLEQDAEAVHDESFGSGQKPIASGAAEGL